MNNPIVSGTKSSINFSFSNGDTAVIRFITPDILKVVYSFNDTSDGLKSFAVISSNEVNTCPEVRDEFQLLPPVYFSAKFEEEKIRILGAKLKVEVNKDSFSVRVFNKDDRLIHEDIPEIGYFSDDNKRINHSFAVNDFHKYYGSGERTGELNKYGHTVKMYCCDSIGYDPIHTDPLYKHIPFFTKVSDDNKCYCGIFYDNTTEGQINFGQSRSGYWPPFCRATFDGGRIEYYIISGSSFSEVLENYTLLTGRQSLVPYYAMGYMASTMYYTEQEKDCDKGIEHFVEQCEKYDIPVDGFHMSSGYTAENGKRCVFNWNKKRFPEPEEYFKWMNERKVYVSPNIKPAMLTVHPLYEEFKKRKAFIINGETGEPQLFRYWGGLASFIDFLSEEGRAAWKEYLKKELLEKGAMAIWDDNNEYEIDKLNSICNDGRNAKALKPVFANVMAKCAVEAYKELGSLRPYILSRSGYAGIQRYAQTWAGDNSTSWESLKYNVLTIMGMGLSGVANQGCDIGGFQGPAPDSELFVRWVENGIFQPRFSIHSCNTDNTVTQPWSFNGYTDYVRKALKLRNSLSLYLYSCLRESNKHGTPVMRPLFFDFSEDEESWKHDFQFMYGPSLMVANVLDKGAVKKRVYLPKGCDWYDYHTLAKYPGGIELEVDAPLGKIPMFIRTGGMLPLIKSFARNEIANTKKISLIVDVSSESTFCLYQDDGITDLYKSGEYLETSISVVPQQGCSLLIFKKDGNMSEITEEIELRLLGSDIAPLSVSVGDKKLTPLLDSIDYIENDNSFYFDLGAKCTYIKYEQVKGNYTVQVDYSIHDLIDM